MTKKNDGAPILVSNKDHHLLKKSNWIIGQNGYVYKKGGRIKNRPCLLHRIIKTPKKGFEIHHKNGNKLDNRRTNLLIVGPSKHQLFHRNETIKRNKKRRKYPLHKNCLGCKVRFYVNPDHRGRNKYCTRRCGNKNKWRFYVKK